MSSPDRLKGDTENLSSKSTAETGVTGTTPRGRSERNNHNSSNNRAFAEVHKRVERPLESAVGEAIDRWKTRKALTDIRTKNVAMESLVSPSQPSVGASMVEETGVENDAASRDESAGIFSSYSEENVAGRKAVLNEAKANRSKCIGENVRDVLSDQYLVAQSTVDEMIPLYKQSEAPKGNATAEAMAGSKAKVYRLKSADDDIDSKRNPSAMEAGRCVSHTSDSRKPSVSTETKKMFSTSSGESASSKFRDGLSVSCSKIDDKDTTPVSWQGINAARRGVEAPSGSTELEARAQGNRTKEGNNDEAAFCLATGDGNGDAASLQERLDLVTSLGFEPDLCRRGLEISDGTVTGTIEWIIGHQQNYRSPSHQGGPPSSVPATSTSSYDKDVIGVTQNDASSCAHLSNNEDELQQDSAARNRDIATPSASRSHDNDHHGNDLPTSPSPSLLSEMGISIPLHPITVPPKPRSAVVALQELIPSKAQGTGVAVARQALSNGTSRSKKGDAAGTSPSPVASGWGREPLEEDVRVASVLLPGKPALIGKVPFDAAHRDAAAAAATEISLMRNAPSPPDDDSIKGRDKGEIYVEDENSRTGTVSPRTTEKSTKANDAARQSHRTKEIESEEEEKQEVEDIFGTSEPIIRPNVPEVAPVADLLGKGRASHAPPPVSGKARLEKVSATVPCGRVFAGSYGVSRTVNWDIPDGPGGDGTMPGSAVPGYDEEDPSPRASSSSHDDTAPPIFLGTLVGAHHERAREQVYEGVTVPLAEATHGGRCRRPLKRMLAVTGILCGVAAIVAVTVILSGRQSNTVNSSSTASTAPSVSVSPSSSPTYEPSGSPPRGDVLILKHIENFFGDSVHEEVAPYANATTWILSEDHTHPMDETSQFLTQRYILALFYYSTNGTDWETKRFLTPDHHCSWYGITCDDDKNVTSINMWENHMVGTLPSELGLMTTIEVINLNRNDLEGTIPSEIGRLTLLRELQLSGYFETLENGSTEPRGRLSGSLPLSISGLTNLEVLALSGNGDLGGMLPDEFYHLKSLRKFYADSTSFSGTISSLIGSLTNLEELIIDRNALSGSIPSSIGNISSLERLLVSFNEFTGLLPEEFFNLEGLTILDCGGNMLKGTISSLVGRLTNLKVLDIRLDQFRERIPESIGNLTALEHLDAYHNDLKEAIPSTIGGLTSLVHLDVSFNDLTGVLPSTIGRLTSLEYFNSHNNDLTGAIPEEFYNVESLAYLGLGKNAFFGTISSLIGRLSNLTELSISDNSFGRALPTAIGNLTSLATFSASRNDLTGPIPDKFYELENLTSLKIQDNALTGTISNLIGGLHSLVWFGIGSNFFTGTIPTELAEIQNIQNIYLRWNNFVGTVSEEFCELDELKTFVADCGPTSSTGPPAVECKCCNWCCDTAQRGDIDACFVRW